MSKTLSNRGGNQTRSGNGHQSSERGRAEVFLWPRGDAEDEQRGVGAPQNAKQSPPNGPERTGAGSQGSSDRQRTF